MPPTIVTGYTADKMDEILSNVIKAASVNGSGHLVVTTYDDTVTDLGVVVGSKGDTGDTGLPGTAGIWLSDGTPSTVNPINTSYSIVSTIVVPIAGYARHIVLWGQVNIAVTSAGIYRAAIRDASGPTTKSHAPWYCETAGHDGSISVVSLPIAIPAGAARTYTLSIRKETGSETGLVSSAGTDETLLVALVTPD